MSPWGKAESCKTNSEIHGLIPHTGKLEIEDAGDGAPIYQHIRRIEIPMDDLGIPATRAALPTLLNR